MKLFILIFLIIFGINFTLAKIPFQLSNDEFDPTATTDFADFKKLFKIPSPKFRLYPTIIPYNYTLKIRPILDNAADVGEQWTAPGTISILVNCVEATNNISLHSGVTILENSVKVIKLSDNQEIPNLEFSRDTEKEFFIIKSPTGFAPTQGYKIIIDFVAEVFTGPNQLSGLYRSHYDDPTTQTTKYLATTQFQAFGARLAFPCFDEPEYKATFDTTIGRFKDNYTAYCNTPIKETVADEAHPDWVWDVFEPTVKMPTYLVAMVISDFTATKADPALYPKPVQTIGPKYLIDEGFGDYTAEIAAKDLAHFEEYFVEEYALAKMDSAAMVDFGAGAMENYGLTAPT